MKIRIIIIIVLLLLIGAEVGYNIYDKIDSGVLPATLYINDQYCGDMHLESAKLSLREAYNSSSVKITVNRKEYVVALDNLAEYNDTAIDNYKIPWYYYLIPTENRIYIDNVVVKRELVDEFLKELLADKPHNAKIKYKDGEFIVKNEKYAGDADGIYEEIRSKIETKNIDITRYCELPKVVSDDLAQECKEKNEYINSDTTFENVSETITSEVKKSHIKDNEIDYDWVDGYVDELAYKYTTLGKTHKFTTMEGEDIEVVGGTYGWQVDIPKTVTRVKKDLKGRNNETKIIYSQKAKHRGLRDVGDTYVEVSIAAQKVCYVKNGKVKLESDCVTGKMTPKRHTFRGVYSVIEKRYNTYLKGATWNTHVMYFMLFNYAGQGFHDATWRSRFGGNIYVGNGSHGCVNMPYSNAEELYKIVDVGTPVVIY